MEKRIEFSEWVDRFKPMMNPADNYDSPLDVGFRKAEWEENGLTVDDMQKAVEERRVWTLMDCEPYPLVCSGMIRVNRLEYYVCEVPVEDGVSYIESDED
jgi:hypothetical protein